MGEANGKIPMQASAGRYSGGGKHRGGEQKMRRKRQIPGMRNWNKLVTKNSNERDSQQSHPNHSKKELKQQDEEGTNY